MPCTSCSRSALVSLASTAPPATTVVAPLRGAFAAPAAEARPARRAEPAGAAGTGLPAGQRRTRCSMARSPCSSELDAARGQLAAGAVRRAQHRLHRVGEIDDRLDADHRGQALDGVQRAEQLAHRARRATGRCAPACSTASRLAFDSAEVLLGLGEVSRRGTPSSVEARLTAVAPGPTRADARTSARMRVRRERLGHEARRARRPAPAPARPRRRGW